jgi:hypothetical protein
MRQRKDRRHTACSEAKKRKISESLSGQKFGGQFEINSNDGKQLRAAARHGDAFVHQGIIDWFRSLKDL